MRHYHRHVERGKVSEEVSTLSVENEGFEQIPQWVVFHPDVTCSAIRLYLVLRFFARGKGVAFPSRRTIADLMQASMPTVDRARKVLTEIGALRTQTRITDSGQTSNLYILAWSPLVTDDEPPSSNMTSPPHQNVEPKSYTTNTHISKSHIDTSSPEPSGATNLPAVSDQSMIERKSGNGAYSADFDMFWDVYPRKVGKKQAYEVWRRAIHDVTPEQIIAGARRYASDPNREDQFTAHPTTWLRRGGWDDEPIPAKSRQRTGGSARMDNYRDLYDRINTRGQITT